MPIVGPPLLTIAVFKQVPTSVDLAQLTDAAIQRGINHAQAEMESFCRQPLRATSHPDPAWPGTKVMLGTIYAHVTQAGELHIVPPYIPIVSIAKVQYKRLAGETWTTIEANRYEVLSDRLVVSLSSIQRGEKGYVSLEYTSGYLEPLLVLEEAAIYVASELIEGISENPEGWAGYSVAGTSFTVFADRESLNIKRARQLLRPFMRVF